MPEGFVKPAGPLAARRPLQSRPGDDLMRREGVRRARRPCSDGGRLTLETRISGVWEGLVAVGEAECPVCAGPMQRSGEVGSCRSCGSVLA